MKRAIASFPAIFVVLFIAASLIGTAIAKTATPRPAAEPGPAYRPTPVPGNAQKPDVGVLLGVLKILLMGVIGVQLVVSIVVIALHVGRQH